MTRLTEIVQPAMLAQIDDHPGLKSRARGPTWPVKVKRTLDGSWCQGARVIPIIFKGCLTHA